VKNKSKTTGSDYDMQIVYCSLEHHGAAMLDIVNNAIAHTTAIYDYHPRTPANMRAWFTAKEKDCFPVIGIEEAGRLLGFASYGSFRAWPAYRYTVESSVYVVGEARGRECGRILMGELIRLARIQDMHTLVACIDMQNTASIRLHEKLGFSNSGVIRQAGYKFGRWLDAGFFQLILDTPAQPIEG
jgi:L-amino acid N-acyltransferase YncA